MSPREFQKILEKFRKGLCTTEEQALIEKWFKAMGSWQDTSLDESAKTEIRRRSWNRIQNHVAPSKPNLTARPPKQRMLSVTSRHMWTLAACISIVAIGVVFLVHTPRANNDQPSLQVRERTIANDTDAEMQVVLNDGSRVLLKPKSKLILPEYFPHTQRRVALEGEAFFDVSRDTLHPFLVHTRQVITKVLGTSFSVSAFADEDNITVSVVTGKVSVMTPKDKDATSASLEETILTPNQKIIYHESENRVSHALVNDPAPIVPQTVIKRMHFEAAPISEIFKGLEQVYGVDIKFDAEIFSSCILTTSIADGDIYSRLDMICQAIDAQYVVNGNHIVITGGGCNH